MYNIWATIVYIVYNMCVKCKQIDLWEHRPCGWNYFKVSTVSDYLLDNNNA